MTMRYLFFAYSLLVSIGNAHADPFDADKVAKNLKPIINTHYPGHIILGPEILDADVRDYFKKKHNGQTPGIACGVMRKTGNIDCGVLLVSDKDRSQGADYFIFIKNANTTRPSISRSERIESKPKYPFTRIFVHLLPPGVIPDRETEIPVKMEFSGVEVVFFEESSIAYFWNKGKIRKVYTSD